MNQTLLLAVLFGGLIISQNISAQSNSPTLSFGLDKVLFGSKTIDVELLASLISDKQHDLKKRIVEKEILAPIFNNTAFVTKNYVFSVIKNLMNEKDLNVLKKEIMEHTSNYALVHTFAEMYLQLTWEEIRTGVYLDSIQSNPEKNKSEFQLNHEKVKDFSKDEFTKLKLALTDSLAFSIRSTSSNKKQSGSEFETVSFNCVLLDMIFHAVRSNPVFLEKGFSNKPLYFSIDQYRSSSYYQLLSSTLLRDKMYTDVKNFIDAIGSLYANFEELMVFMDNQEERENEDAFEAYQQQMISHPEFDSTIQQTNNDLIFNSRLFLKTSVDSLTNELSRIKMKGLRDDTESKKMFEDLYVLLYSIENQNTAGQAKIAHERINQVFLPKLSVLNNQEYGELQPVISDLEQVNHALKITFQKPLIQALHNKNLCRQIRNILTERKEVVNLYLEFFSRLDKLDETQTYYYLLKNLLMCGDQINEQSSAKAMNVILNAIDKYTSFDSQDDRIAVDVESIILTLFDFYGQRGKNPVNFYLTMGANNSFTLGDALENENRESVNNFSHISEKMGLRINLINFQMRSTYTEGEFKPHSRLLHKNKTYVNANRNYQSEPVVSNMHLLVFGTGLVYQLADLSTSKNLNTSFMGTGMGMTFYNNLSLNTSVLIPIEQNRNINFDEPFLNVGVDVYITQYITAYTKKRKEAKQAKLDLEKYRIDREYGVEL